MEDFADAMSIDAGVNLHQLPPLTSLLVWTRNSSYRIIVMEGGRLAESGTREELLAQGGIYASMIRTKREMETRPAQPAAVRTA